MSPSKRLMAVGLLWAVTLGVVVAGAGLGKRFIHARGFIFPRDSILHRLTWAWDGRWYNLIARDGYSFSTTRQSSVVFFPAFPLAARWLAGATGLSRELALLTVSNGCWLAALVVMVAYVRDRLAADEAAGRAGPLGRSAAVYAVIVMAVWPTTFFFRVAYTEALLLLTQLLTMYGIRRRWHPLLLAVVVGLATATRSVGVALLVPFALHLWDRARHPPGGPPRRGLAAVVAALPGLGWLAVGCWGVAGFLAFQARAFHDPLAMTVAQKFWKFREPAPTLAKRVLNLVTLEPIWGSYTRSSALYWNLNSPRNEPGINVYFLNPIYFVAAAALVVYGLAKGWVNRSEAALSAGLLLIPYVLQVDRQGMTSMARFAAVVFPAYLVGGQLLAREPRWVAVSILVVGLALLGMYVSIFSSGFPMY